MIHTIDDYSKVSANSFAKVGIELPKEFDQDKLNSLVVAAKSADLVITVDGPNAKPSKELLSNTDFKPHIGDIKKKLETVTLKSEDNASCNDIADSINEILLNTFG